MAKKVKIVKKFSILECYRCGGTGETLRRRKSGWNPSGCSKMVPCRLCRGTGKYREYHYWLTVGKLAIDMDTLK